MPRPKKVDTGGRLYFHKVMVEMRVAGPLHATSPQNPEGVAYMLKHQPTPATVAARQAAGAPIVPMDDLAQQVLEETGAEEGKEAAGARLVEVSISTADRLVSSGQARPPDLMKIDVEGQEIEVLKGAVFLLLYVKPKLVIECHRVPLGSDAGYARLNICAVWAFLDAAGYDVRRLEGEDDRLFATPREASG